MNPSTNVLILTEAGKEIGFGHYTRCSAIRQELTQNNIPCDMYVWVNEAQLKDNQIIPCNWILEPTPFMVLGKYNAIIIDSYRCPEHVYKQLNEVCSNIIALDDYNRMIYPVGTVVNPNVFFPDMDYSNQSATCYGGKDYVILRKPFRETPEQAAIKQTPQTILITLGGSDYRNLLSKIIEDCLLTATSEIVAIDPENKISNPSPEKVKILPAQDADSMCQWIREADIVISACGQTLHELAACGKATIGILLDIDQIPNSQFYHKAGFLNEAILWNDSNRKEKIIRDIYNYQHTEIRKQRSELGPRLINRNGVRHWIKLTQNEHHISQ